MPYLVDEQQDAVGNASYQEWEREKEIDFGLVWFWEEDIVKMLQMYTSLYGKEKEEFIRKRKEYADKMCTHARLVEIGFGSKDAIGTQRCNEIFSRLKKLGYTDHDLKTSGFKRWDVLTTTPKMLTERIWRNPRPDLEQIIEAEKNSNYFQRRLVLSENDDDDEE
ncbi:hypothetical protein ACEPAF_5174 [Sanghuangporus sanghuang]